MNDKNSMNNTTEMVFILDRSGSMAGLESDTIGGFNGMIAKQKKEEGEAFVTTILFDDQYEVLHDRIPLHEVKALTDKDYTVRGCTALLDAVGKAIEHISSIHKYARPEDVPAHTIFVITTDGMENASHQYNYKAVKALIEQKKERGWEFLFIGSNIDAVAEAARIGISRDRAATNMADSMGTSVAYEAISAPISAMRKCGKIVGAGWKRKIDEDLAKRSK